MMTRPAPRTTLALALLLLVPAPARGTAGGPDLDRETAVARVARARGLIASGGLEGAVRAATGLAGALSAETAPVVAVAPAGTPAPIAAEVGRLAAEVERAGSAALGALRVSPKELTRLMAEGDRALAAVRTLPGVVPDPAAERRLEQVAARLEAAVDAPAVHAAALGLARAIDETLPALHAYAATLPPGGEEAPCDVAEQGPICVGGTGSNTYTNDAALLIDLGGDDVHANSAGGGWLGNPGSVTIDLAGNDRYETAVPTAAGAFTVQGAGVLGVGILVDAAGNDTYSATAPTKSGGVYAQGVGGGAGVGILADLAGNDVYTLSNILTNATPGSAFSLATPGAQGMADTAGIGIMLDREGNDTYLVEAGSCAGCHAEPHAFGYAEFGGIGLHVDGGGTDRMTLRAVGPDVPLHVSDPPAGTGAEINPFGFGWGIMGGVGLDLSGQGPTTRHAIGRNGAPASAGVEVRVFGHADRASFGAVSDLGGNDVYRADAYSQDVRHLTVDDSCECDGVLASAVADQASVIGMAYSQLGASALLEDGGGNDQYLSRAASYAEAVAHDDRTVIPPPAPMREDLGAQAEAALFYNNFSIVQGTAGQAGASFLIDAAGDDLYLSEAGGDAVARASAFLEESALSATANAPGGWSTAQGQSSLGYAELRDLGGTDTYRSVSRSGAVTEPSGGATAGNPVAAVQGDGQGWLFDIGGTADVFVSTPPNPACTGTRGGEMWLDCGNTGGGVNR